VKKETEREESTEPMQEQEPLVATTQEEIGGFLS